MSKLGIQINDLRLSFGSTVALSITNATLHVKQPTVILGPNGAGKSLLLRLLHGLSKPDWGRIEFPKDYRGKEVQAMVFQRPILLRRDALANVTFPMEARGISKIRALHLARMWMERAQLGHLMGTPARRLSGGEQQRLSLVRALALEPKILFLDEPCAHLDPSATVKVEALVEDAIKSGVKIIMVTHDAAQAKRLGEEIILMHQGKMIAQHNKMQFFSNDSSPRVRQFLAGEPLV